MTVEEIINGTGDVTPEVLDGLSHKDLKQVATELFEIENWADYTKDQLLYECKEKLTEATHENNRSTVESFVRNLDNQEKAVGMALNIRNVFDRNWFEVKDLVAAYKRAILRNIKSVKDPKEKELAEQNFKTNPPTIENVTAELSTLMLFALVKKKSFSNGKKVKYKVVMTVVTKALERRKKEELEKIEKEKYDKAPAEAPAE